MKENFPELGLEARSCEHGRGIFATRDFKKGDIILTFTGPVVSTAEAIENDTMGNPMQIGMEKYQLIESPGVLVNHSCDPNAALLDDSKLIARRAISISQEIFWDYSTSMDEDDWTLQCLCGTSKCRGVVRDFKFLTPEVQNQYLIENAVMAYIAKQFKS